jgi:hypothetical protein
VLALAGITLLALAGVAVSVGSLLTQQERFHASVPDDPKRRGPLVEITSGDNWALIGWRSDVGICLDFAIPGNSPFGCGFPVRGAKPATDASGSGLPTHAPERTGDKAASRRRKPSEERLERSSGTAWTKP